MSESRRRLMFQLPWPSAARIQADVAEELRLELRDDARLVWRGMRRTPGFAAAAFSRVLAGVLVGVAPRDLLTFVA